MITFCEERNCYFAENIPREKLRPIYHYILYQGTSSNAEKEVSFFIYILFRSASNVVKRRCFLDSWEDNIEATDGVGLTRIMFTICLGKSVHTSK